MRNNWLSCDFKKRRIRPTRYAIRTYGGTSGGFHLKSSLVETSLDGKNWRAVDRHQGNGQLNGRYFRGTFALPAAGSAASSCS
jgi:hypothetical protein